MREMYCGYALWQVLYSERGDCERNKRKLQLVLERKVTRRSRGFLARVGAMLEYGKFRVEKFNGPNYQLWKMQLEDYLYHKDLFLPLGRVEKKPTTMKNE
jgi:hypothetical protein